MAIKYIKKITLSVFYHKKDIFLDIRPLHTGAFSGCDSAGDIAPCTFMFKNKSRRKSLLESHRLKCLDFLDARTGAPVRLFPARALFCSKSRSILLTCIMDADTKKKIVVLLLLRRKKRHRNTKENIGFILLTRPDIILVSFV